MVGKQDEIADGGQIGAGRFGDLRDRIAAEFFDAINGDGARLLEHVAQLAFLIGRVDRDKGYASQSGGELQQRPFGKIVREDRYSLTRGMAVRQGPRQSFGIGPQLLVCPIACWLAVLIELFQGEAAAMGLRLTAQHVANRHLSNRL